MCCHAHLLMLPIYPPALHTLFTMLFGLFTRSSRGRKKKSLFSNRVDYPNDDKKQKNISFFKPKYGSLPTQEVCCSNNMLGCVFCFFKVCLSFLINLMDKRACKHMNTNTCKPNIIFALQRFSWWNRMQTLRLHSDCGQIRFESDSLLSLIFQIDCPHCAEQGSKLDVALFRLDHIIEAEFMCDVKSLIESCRLPTY